MHATDTGTHWHVTVSADPVVVERTEREAGATLRGPAADVYLALWNRLSLGALDAFGDPEILQLWPLATQVRWS